MNRTIELLKNITAELLNYLVVCSCAYIILVDFTKQSPVGGIFAVCMVIPLFFYVLREWCDRLWLFLVLHGLPVLVIVLFYKGNSVYKAAIVTIAVLYTCLSVGKRIRSTGRGMEVAAPVVVAGIYLALYLLDYVQAGGENGALLLQLMISFFSGYFVFYYLQQFLSYVYMNARTTENIPVKRVFFSSAGLALGFSAAAFCLITVFANRSLITRISALLKSLLRRLLSLVKINPPEITVEPEIWERQSGSGFPDLGEEVEPSLFVQIMDVLLTLAAFGLILFFLIKGIIILRNLLKEGFAAKGYKRKFAEVEVSDRIEQIIVKEDKNGEKQKPLLERWRQAISPEERIRRIYKKTILKSIPSWEGEKIEGLLSTATARECCLRQFSTRLEYAGEFAGLYEKARYAKGLCRPEDVKRMKKLAEELHAVR